MEQFARTIQQIHEKQYVVLDIYDYNTMYKLDGNEIESINLVDLGLSKKIGENIGKTYQRYSPPEYLATEYVYDFLAYKATTSYDVYSLGLTYLGMLIPLSRYNKIILTEDMESDKYNK